MMDAPDFQDILNFTKKLYDKSYKRKKHNKQMSKENSLLQDLKAVIDKHFKSDCPKFKVGAIVNIIYNNRIVLGMVNSVVMNGSKGNYYIELVDEFPIVRVWADESNIAYV